MDQRILVVDESELVCQQLGQLLNRPGRQVAFARDVTTALEWLVEHGADLVVADLDLPGLGGVDLIREVDDRGLSTTILALTGPAGLDRGLAAMALGAYDLLVRPIDLDRLEFLVEQALADARLTAELAGLTGEHDRRFAFDALAVRFPGLGPTLERLVAASARGVPVVIAGAGPTEASLLIRALHAGGARRHGSLVRVDGRSRSAPRAVGNMIAAATARNGPLSARRAPSRDCREAATLWLDGIDALPLDDQASLVGLLTAPAGPGTPGVGSCGAAIGLVATAALPLAQATADGRFRADLLAQLDGEHLVVPPLSQRPADVPALAEALLQELTPPGRPHLRLAPETVALLVVHAWTDDGEPALRSVLARATARAAGDRIEPAHLPDANLWGPDPEVRLDFDLERPLRDIIDEIESQIERAYLIRLLNENQGRIASSAVQAGLSRRSIHEKLTRYGIDKADYKPRPGRRRRASQAISGAPRRTVESHLSPGTSFLERTRKERHNPLIDP